MKIWMLSSGLVVWSTTVWGGPSPYAERLTCNERLSGKSLASLGRKKINQNTLDATAEKVSSLPALSVYESHILNSAGKSDRQQKAIGWISLLGNRLFALDQASGNQLRLWELSTDSGAVLMFDSAADADASVVAYGLLGSSSGGQLFVLSKDGRLARTTLQPRAIAGRRDAEERLLSLEGRYALLESGSAPQLAAVTAQQELVYLSQNGSVSKSFRIKLREGETVIALSRDSGGQLWLLTSGNRLLEWDDHIGMSFEMLQMDRPPSNSRKTVSNRKIFVDRSRPGTDRAPVLWEFDELDQTLIRRDIWTKSVSRVNLREHLDPTLQGGQAFEFFSEYLSENGREKGIYARVGAHLYAFFTSAETSSSTVILSNRIQEPYAFGEKIKSHYGVFSYGFRSDIRFLPAR